MPQIGVSAVLNGLFGRFDLSKANTRPFDILMPDRPLIFLHIEKTAGTAFVSHLSRQLSCCQGDVEVFRGGSTTNFFGEMNRKLYYGHFEFGEAYRLKIVGCYVTMLRSPLRRAFSQYSSWHNPNNLTADWVSVLPRDQIRAVEAVHQMTFDEYVLSENPLVSGHINDLMSKRLAIRRWGIHKDLGNAFSSLERHFKWFGIVEEFTKSLQLFQFQFGGSTTSRMEVGQSNVSVLYDDQLSTRGRKRLIELNRHDQALYDAAVELFHKRYNDLPVDLDFR